MEPEKSSDEPVTTSTSSTQETTQTKKPKQPWTKKKKLLVACILVALAVIAGVVWYFAKSDTPIKNESAVVEQKTQTPTKQVETDPILAKFITPTTGETWYDEPKLLSDQKFKVPDEYSETKYYEVGKHGDKTIILSVINQLGDFIQLYEKASNGTVAYIAQPDAYANYANSSDPSYDVSFGISIDTTTRYDSLSMPQQFTVNKSESANRDEYLNLGSFIYDDETDTSSKSTLVTKLGNSSLNKIERSFVDTNLTGFAYAISTPIGSRITLQYNPIPAELTNYTWNNSSASTDSIAGIIRGCGGIGNASSRYDTAKDDEFVVAGKTASGQVVYALKDSNASLVQKAYDEYVDFNTYEGAPATLSKDEFLKQHGIVAYKNTANEWLIYTSNTLAPQAGCAKPVVYLYPTKTQKVSVRVGADVKISEPLYDAVTGWCNVTAQPNGQLTYQGKMYSSLFWEGPGIGEYPAITGGSVVKRSEAVNTMKRQLAQQGLNQQEITDFMAYWTDKIPNKPYVRLSWFTTTQLNSLAPLYITPKPDTLIRVFLDMEGLDKKIMLPAQKLISIPRNGFTVTEWGGLSRTKLY